MNKQPQKTEATKQSFIDAFCELSETMPIDKITIQALTRKAGYNRSTFYTYFSNIGDLMEHIENEVISFVKENIFETIENAGAADKFIAMFAKDVQKIEEKYLGVLFANPARAGFAARLKDALLPAFIAQFNISPDNLKARYVLDFHISGMISIMTAWIMSGRDISTDDLGEVVRGILAKGVLKTLTIG